MSTNSTTPTQKIENRIPTHPEYDAVRPLWDQMRVTSAGEQAVKGAGSTYLPKTMGQEADAVNGQKYYDAYKTRAVYYEYLRDTQSDMIGLLTKEPTTFEVPPRLEPYIERASSEGEGISELQRRVFDEQLVPSRGGLLLEVETDKGMDTTPVSVLYSAERIVNWDDDNTPPRWIVLDESRNVREDNSLARVLKTEYLLLALDGNDQYYTYRFKTWPSEFDMDDPGEPTEDTEGVGALVYPELIGERLSVIPFTFFNATTVTPDVELPVLLSLSNLTLSVYRGEADYRQTLFMQGQETLFLKGFSFEERANLRMGASSFIATNNAEADAEFIGISAEGLTESRESQESLKTECKNLGVELIENGAESGAALNTRLTVRTASLSDIARVAAAALAQQLKYAALWLGLSQDEIDAIKVTAATDFSSSNAQPKEILELWAVVQQGGMTLEDYHRWLSENDFTELQFQDWYDMVQTTGGLALGDFGGDMDEDEEEGGEDDE